MWARAGYSKIRHNIKQRRLFLSLLLMLLLNKQRSPLSLFSVPQSSRWARMSHGVFFLSAHLNVNDSYQFGQIGHMKQKYFSFYLIHKLTLTLSINTLAFKTTTLIAVRHPLPCNPFLSDLVIGNVFLFYFLYGIFSNWQRSTSEYWWDM